MKAIEKKLICKHCGMPGVCHSMLIDGMNEYELHDAMKDANDKRLQELREAKRNDMERKKWHEILKAESDEELKRLQQKLSL